MLLAQDQHDQTPLMHTPVPAPAGPLRSAQLLIRDGKTEEARKDLEQQRKSRPNDPELLFQIARSHLVDFYRLQDPERRRIALGLAMEVLGEVLKHDPNHIPALRAKAVIHARAELLYARLDLIPADDGKPLISELELIEPSLFLVQHPPALERLVEGIAALEKSGGS